ncbi:hypothetical protein V5799_006413 [Amblyomma americanum]|uniref:Large ribosomal subunit protein mL51 n=1 Tax=Amblyomma americanum TaxID=6943 RepID=A0AAQ4DWG6_AMBAM
MSTILHSALQRLVARTPIQMSVRFWERKKYIRRYGYESPLHPPDILGSGDVKPIDIMKGVPNWLRGFQGNEFQMLLRKRPIVYHWRKSRPTDFHNLNKRIRFLYKVLNHRTRSK